MKVPFVFLKREAASEKGLYAAALDAVTSSGNYILGEYVDKLEQALSSYLGVKYVVTLNSGTDSLILTLKAMGIGNGDEVITVGNSFIATIGAIVAVGAKPVLVDVRDDLLIDPDRIYEKITPKTRAIIPVHLTGRPCAMNEINSIAMEYGLYVIDDAAQSFGATYFGQRFFDTHASCYSFHPLKNFHCLGDGGAVATNNEDVYRSLIKLRNHGLVGRASECFGYNSRLDELQAAILLSTLPLLDMKLRQRREKARKYIDGIKDIVTVPEWEIRIMEPTFQTFVIQTDKRDGLASFLCDRNIETKIHYPIPCHQQNAFSILEKVHLPNTEMQAKKVLSLPISHLLTDDEQDYVIDTIRSFFNGAGSFC